MTRTVAQRLVAAWVAADAQKVGKCERGERTAGVSRCMGSRPLDGEVAHDLVSEVVRFLLITAQRFCILWTDPDRLYGRDCAENALQRHGNLFHILAEQGFRVGALHVEGSSRKQCMGSAKKVKVIAWRRW